ncbi:MAG TPA: D-aminoacyl-tRNA deacylase [Pyrinomonadaceae bacterium]|jgi:D-tyrosyl-tRNA(Tyr) deacylase
MPEPKAVYFFCRDLTKDPVAPRVFEAAVGLTSPRETGLVIDGDPVLVSRGPGGESFFYVRTEVVLSHDFARYLPALGDHFGGFDFAGLVNWHGGAKAPDGILTVHTTGDVVTGHYGPAHPLYTRNLLLALEANRRRAGLDAFRVTTEATHWSGIPYGGRPELIPDFRVPLVDVEIGSAEGSWADPAAARTVALSLREVFGDATNGRLRSLLCAGGVHLEAVFASAVLDSTAERPLAVSHILPNHWVVEGGYDQESALDKLESCVGSIVGGIHAVVVHDDLKGRYKATFRAAAERLGLPLLKHRALRSPAELPLWAD